MADLKRKSIEPIASAIGNGVRFSWMTFDEDYGKVPAFWFELDRLGQRSIGEVPANFHCWPTRRLDALELPPDDHGRRRTPRRCPLTVTDRWHRRRDARDYARLPQGHELRELRQHLEAPPPS